MRGVYIGLRQDLDPLTRKLSKRRLCCTVKGLAYAFNPSLPFSSTSFCLIMEGPYSEVAKDQEEGNVADHNTKAADNRPEAADHKTKAADNRPESADHKTKAAEHNTPEHNDCLPGFLSLSVNFAEEERKQGKYVDPIDLSLTCNGCHFHGVFLCRCSSYRTLILLRNGRGGGGGGEGGSLLALERRQTNTTKIPELPMVTFT